MDSLTDLTVVLLDRGLRVEVVDDSQVVSQELDAE